jgi:plastocyanin
VKRRASLASALLVAASATLALYACVTGQAAAPTGGGTTEGGLVESTGAMDAGAPTDAGADSAPIVCMGDSGPDNDGAVGLNMCPLVVDGGVAAFVDRTCTTASTLQWSLNVTPFDPNRCMKVKAGSTVTWVANPSFNTHPLEPLGGDTPTPFSNLDLSGKSVTVTFPQAGTFGYHCHNHPSAMQGVIEVVP